MTWCKGPDGRVLAFPGEACPLGWEPMPDPASPYTTAHLSRGGEHWKRATSEDTVWPLNVEALRTEADYVSRRAGHLMTWAADEIETVREQVRLREAAVRRLRQTLGQIRSSVTARSHEAHPIAMASVLYAILEQVDAGLKEGA